MVTDIELALVVALKTLDEIEVLLENPERYKTKIGLKLHHIAYLLEGCLVKLNTKDLNTCNLQDFMGKPVKTEKNPQPQCVVKPLDGQVSKKNGVKK